MSETYDPNVHPLEHFCRDLEAGEARVQTRLTHPMLDQKAGEYVSFKPTIIIDQIRKLLAESIKSEL